MSGGGRGARLRWNKKPYRSKAPAVDETKRVSSYTYSPGDLKGAVADTEVETRGNCASGYVDKYLDGLALALGARVVRRV